MTGEKRKREPWSGRRRVAGFLILAMCCMAGAAGGVYISHRKAPAQTEGLAYEANIVMGDIPGKTPEERQRELDSVVEEGMMIFSINATPFMIDGKGKANLMVENPPNNGKRFTVTIQRDDTGEVIYKSGYLDPEQYIDEVPLDVELAKGEYACTAYFDAYRLSDDGYIGRAGARITLYVLE